MTMCLQGTYCYDICCFCFKELFSYISHLMNRLVKQELASTIMTLATTFFRIHEKVVSKETLNNMAHNLNVMHWKFSFKLEPSMSQEFEVLSLINIHFFCAQVLDTPGQVLQVLLGQAGG